MAQCFIDTRFAVDRRRNAMIFEAQMVLDDDQVTRLQEFMKTLVLEGQQRRARELPAITEESCYGQESPQEDTQRLRFVAESLPGEGSGSAVVGRVHEFQEDKKEIKGIRQEGASSEEPEH